MLKVDYGSSVLKTGNVIIHQYYREMLLHAVISKAFK